MYATEALDECRDELAESERTIADYRALLELCRIHLIDHDEEASELFRALDKALG